MRLTGEGTDPVSGMPQGVVQDRNLASFLVVPSEEAETVGCVVESGSEGDNWDVTPKDYGWN